MGQSKKPWLFNGVNALIDIFGSPCGCKQRACDNLAGKAGRGGCLHKTNAIGFIFLYVLLTSTGVDILLSVMRWYCATKMNHKNDVEAKNEINCLKLF